MSSLESKTRSSATYLASSTAPGLPSNKQITKHFLSAVSSPIALRDKQQKPTTSPFFVRKNLDIWPLTNFWSQFQQYRTAKQVVSQSQAPSAKLWILNISYMETINVEKNTNNPSATNTVLSKIDMTERYETGARTHKPSRCRSRHLRWITNDSQKGPIVAPRRSHFFALVVTDGIAFQLEEAMAEIGFRVRLCPE